MKNINGKDFLFSNNCGFINGSDDESYQYSDGSGYYHGADGSDGYIYSDGSGYYHGADGSDGYIYSDGSAYFHGADGSDGYKYSDGSGYYHGADGSDGYIDSDGNGFYYDADGTNYYHRSDDVGSLHSSANYESGSNNECNHSATSFSDSLRDLLNLYIEAQELHDQEQHRKKQQERKAKFCAWYQTHWKGLLISFFCILVLLFCGIIYYEFTIRIPVGYSSSELIGKNYQDVVQFLRYSGFSSVNLKAIDDLKVTDLNKEYLVTEVKIGWYSTFNQNSKYPSNFIVTVTYHTLEEINCPMSSKEVKGYYYQDVIKIFEDAGFTNISVKIKYDIITGWFTDDGEVKSITISGNNKFSAGDRFRPNADVVITYHTLMKNKPK